MVRRVHFFATGSCVLYYKGVSVFASLSLSLSLTHSFCFSLTLSVSISHSLSLSPLPLPLRVGLEVPAPGLEDDGRDVELEGGGHVGPAVAVAAQDPAVAAQLDPGHFFLFERAKM